VRRTTLLFGSLYRCAFQRKPVPDFIQQLFGAIGLDLAFGLIGSLSHGRGKRKLGGFQMLRHLLLGIAVMAVSGCMETAGPSFNGPSGALVSTAKCNRSSVGCLQNASQACGGPYQVLDSESHAGGLLADVMAGPVTWYSMTYQCGPSDGKMPAFAFRGPQYVAPAEVNVTVNH
jgi:hypothetical protein